MKKKWLAALGILAGIGVIAAVLIYVFVYNKPQPDYSKEKPDFMLNAESLFREFQADPAKASARYNGKVLEVTGSLSSVYKGDSLVIAVFAIDEGMFGEEGIRFAFIPEFASQVESVAPGTSISIKGYCTGFNDTDVIMEHCSLQD
ncbi:MAG TPA: hypothetical protein VK212_09185 [Lentimicrobium sp.]|nr:hypothetical protein [Lentimicrobium sp.]